MVGHDHRRLRSLLLRMTASSQYLVRAHISLRNEAFSTKDPQSCQSAIFSVPTPLVAVPLMLANLL